MATVNNSATTGPLEKDHGVIGHDHAGAHNGVNSGGYNSATATNGTATHRNPYIRADGNPLAHYATNDSSLNQGPFGGAFQPGLYRQPKSRIANPAPLGLSAFALTTFILSLINMRTRGVAEPNIIISSAFAYGGLVQLLAGMWEMAVGNTFGATALSSYGGFWISFAIILTPSFGIATALGGGSSDDFHDSVGFFLAGWFIFTTILLLCTLRSTVMFFLLFFWLDLAFLMLTIGYLQRTPTGALNLNCIKAGGFFGLPAAFWAWYNAFAGIADSSNSFFTVPVIHFPWSEKGRERRGKVNNDSARADANV